MSSDEKRCLKLVELEPRKRVPNPFLVDQLERMLSLARDGELAMVTCAYVRPSGRSSYWLGSGNEGVRASVYTLMVGELEDLQGVLLSRVRSVRGE